MMNRQQKSQQPSQQQQQQQSQPHPPSMAHHPSSQGLPSANDYESMRSTASNFLFGQSQVSLPQSAGIRRPSESAGSSSLAAGIGNSNGNGGTSGLFTDILQGNCGFNRKDERFV